MPSPRLLRPLIFLGTLVLVSLAGLAWRAFGPPSPRERVESARETLRLLRAEAQACQDELRQEEVGFRSFEGEVGELRARIDALESLDPRGVPGDSYAIYLELVNEFNLVVPDWSTRADSLQSAWEECRAAVDAHNAAADSLVLLLAEEGITIPQRVPLPPQRFIQPEWDTTGG